MPNKHRGDIDFRFPDGAFKVLAVSDQAQLYRVFECEASHSKTYSIDVSESDRLLLLCLCGEGTVKSEDYAADIRTASTLYLSNGMFTIRTLSYECPVRCVGIVFSPTENEAFQSDDMATVMSFYRTSTTSMHRHCADGVARAFASLIAEVSLPNPTMLLLKGCFYQILIEGYRSFVKRDAVRSDDTININAVGHTVYAIICYIDDHLFSMNNLMEMAQELGYSYNYLSHLFRRKTGMTIQTYVSRKKIEQSTKLLLDERYSITEIATMLNYDCIQSFSKAFRRAMGESPTEYRTKHSVNCTNELI